MKVGFYPKLAWEGIRKNNRLYFPYILTGSVMVMIYYILSFLIESPAIAHMPKSSILLTVLPLGCGVIAVFSLLFLFYTNSFLLRQRYREFGLYNILGMDKRNISKIMLWESVFVAVFAIASGLVAGIALSKISELALLNLLNMEITFDFSIGIKSLYQTPLCFGVIYLLLLFNSLVRVRRAKPLELMKSNKVGERVPKRTWIYALIGVVFLAVAYYLAVSIKNPVRALTTFFGAVLLVIGGTYLIFIAGSVVFCKLLQKNKKYYYKPNHFVSVSSMVYRMKRNGAGLASICILLTMVLVMISSTTSLYFGVEDSLKNRYPSGVNITARFDNINGISDETLDMLKNKIKEHCGGNADLTGVRACQTSGLFTEDGIKIMLDDSMDVAFNSYDNIGYLSVISLEDYNSMMDLNKTLADDECLIYSERLSFEWDTFTMEFGETYKVKERLGDFKTNGDLNGMVMPTVYLVVKDLYSFAEPVRGLENFAGDPMMVYNWTCGFDLDTAEAEITARSNIYEMFKNLRLEENTDNYPFSSQGYSFSVESRELNRNGIYDLYGSLFFLGIMLSIVFILAAVLLIYYKQISEGYEDHSGFEIMQKVGMTKKDIRKSINSQMLTAFFMPLVFAGIHLTFAFPVISKILMMFGYDNTLLNAVANLVCFAVCGLFYAIVYKITSNAYYTIVSGRKE